MIIKYLYTLFIGLLFATFVGVGVAAFYEQPKYPEYPDLLNTPVVSKPDQPPQETLEQITARQRYQVQEKQYQQDIKIYNRNVSAFTLAGAIVVLVLSLTFLKKLQMIADGLLVGGVFTLLYSIIRGFETDDNKFRFLVVSIGLFVALALGYLKFVKPLNKTTN